VEVEEATAAVEADAVDDEASCVAAFDDVSAVVVEVAPTEVVGPEVASEVDAVVVDADVAPDVVA